MMKWLQFLNPVKSLDYKQADSYIKEHDSQDIIVLDVRQPSEYEKNHIPGAILIPLPQLSDRLNEIDPEKSVLVY